MFKSFYAILAILAVAPLGQAIVSGTVFDRFVTIWLENTDFTTADADPNIEALAKEGILLTNYFALTHTSEPNYVAGVGGEYFGMNNDNLFNVPANISTVVDLLDSKGITWAEYMQDMPSTGFQGMQFLNAKGANDYVRKHNPLIIYESISGNATRSANTKNFTLFDEDLANGLIPQWVFITPNLTNDGHDTNVTFAGTFTRGFLTPLLANPNFNNNRTLIFLTWDETATSTIQNRVVGILLGGAVPTNLIGTTDTNFYNHYSQIATVEANWDLPTLGRYDVGANVFSFVAAQTGDKIRSLTSPLLSLAKTLLDSSYPGIFNSAKSAPIPVPNTTLVVNGRPVLPQIVKTWGSAALQACAGYNGSLGVPSAKNPPVLPKGC
jgi:acid phosphatase